VIYVLYGSDSFSRTERLHELERELDADGSLTANIVEFQVGQATPAEVMAACDTVPFLGGRRLVVLEGALSSGVGQARGRRSRRQAASGDADGVERGPWWALVEYAGRMPETTTLVLVDGGSVDDALLDALKPFATVEVFWLPGPKDVASWIQNRARAIGLQIDGRACSAIAERIGNDTWILANEIEKLAAFANGDRITENDVKALVPDVKEVAGYLLSDAISDGKPALATRLLHELLEKNHVPPVLLLTIENRYRRLAVAREMMNAGATGTQIGSTLSMSGYGLERLLEQASRMSAELVRGALDRIAQTDQDVKEGRFDSEVVSLELLVHDLATDYSGAAGSQRVSAAAGSA
jgi:DNA polymerase III subunit delta